MKPPGSRRLWLVGDDEALDALAEMSHHLDYFSVARLDEPPAEPLGAADHLVVGTADPLRGPQMLAELLAHGRPGFARLLEAESTEQLRPGARAILMAATLLKYASQTQ